MGFLDNLKTRRIDNGWFWKIFHPAQELTEKSNPVKRKVKVVARASNQKFDRNKVQKWASDHGKTIYRPGEQPVTELPVVELSATLQYAPSFQGSNYFPLSMQDIINGYRLHINGSVTDPSGKTIYAKQGTKLIPRFQGGGYTIKKGDTLSKIAKSHNMSLRLLLSLNKDIKNPDKINVGLKIKISAGSSNAPTSKPSSPYRSGIARMNESNSTARDWGNNVRQLARERGLQADEQAKKKITVTSNKSKDIISTIAKQSNQSGIKGIVTKEPLIPMKLDISTPQQTDLGHAIYLHYPNFIGHSTNAVKIGNVDLGEVIGNPDLPVGHAATIMIDPNRNATYYEYGRYSGSGFGHVRQTTKGGNWRKIELPPLNINEDDSSYVARILNRLPDTNTGAYQAMTIPNVDTDKAIEWINQQANNQNRREYGITNTCADGACNATFKFLKKPEFHLNRIFNSSGYSTNSKLWSLIPFLSTGAHARAARAHASKVYTMNL